MIFIYYSSKMDLTQYRFVLPMEVRDYELDTQCIVNNANYLHYLEHTRHQFCKQEGFSFRDMHEQGIDPVLSRAVLDYKTPLKSGDKFLSCLTMERRGPKFVFHQDIFLEDGTPVLSAEITVACMENGRLSRGDVLADAFNLK